MVHIKDDSPIVALLRHNTWANLRLLDACAGLTEAQLAATVPGTRGSIRDTLLHIVGSEDGYLGLLTGWQPAQPLKRGEFPGVAVLRAHATEAGARLADAAAHLRATDIVRTEWQGAPNEVRAGIVLIQVINHASEHRAHVTTILTQQGITPPEIDGWSYGDAPEEAG